MDAPRHRFAQRGHRLHCPPPRFFLPPTALRLGHMKTMQMKISKLSTCVNMHHGHHSEITRDMIQTKYADPPKPKATSKNAA